MPERQAMPAMPKSPPELVERFKATLARFPQAEVRPMFGQTSAFVNGQMFTGLFGDRWHVRLPDDARAEAMADGGEPFAPMLGRPMRGYVVLPPHVVDQADRLTAWLDKAERYVAALPHKEKTRRSGGRSASGA